MQPPKLNSSQVRVVLISMSAVYFFAISDLTQFESAHLGSLIVNLTPITLILFLQFFTQFRNPLLPALAFTILLVTRFVWEGKLWGDSGYYFQVANDELYRDSVGYEPTVLMSAPFASLVFAFFMRHIPEIAIYIAPISFTIISFIVFQLIKTRVKDIWYSTVFAILFIQSSIISIFSYSNYIELYVFSNLISSIVLFFYLRLEKFTLLKSFLLGLICLTHLLFLPLWLLNFINHEKVKLHYKVVVSSLGLGLAGLFVYAASSLQGYPIMRGNLPMKDSVIFQSIASEFRVGILATTVFALIAYTHFGILIRDKLFIALIFIYVLFASFWNFKLGFPQDLDLLLAPSFILGIAGFVMIRNDRMPFDRNRLLFAGSGISVLNSIIASGFIQ